MDPYYPEYFEKFSSEEEAIRAYFAETLENLKCHDDYDVLGHLDYIVRVAPSKDKITPTINIRMPSIRSWNCWFTAARAWN